MKIQKKHSSYYRDFNVKKDEFKFEYTKNV